MGQYGRFHCYQGGPQQSEYVLPAIQLAHLSGFSPIITTASLKNSEYLKRLGATHVIDRHLPLSDLPTTVGSITKEPFGFVFAAVAPADVQHAAYDLVAADGTVIVVQPVVIEQSRLVPNKHIEFIFASPTLPDRKHIGADIYKHLTALFESGAIKVPYFSSSSCAALMPNASSQPGPVEALPGGLAGIPAGVERVYRGEVHLLKLIGHPQDAA